MDYNFQTLLGTFKSSIKTWDYFVNWNKVESNFANVEIALNKLNYLLGKDDLRQDFRKLYGDNPDVIEALPILLAVRDRRLEIFDKRSKTSKVFDFNPAHRMSADEAFMFLEKSGLIRLFQRDGIKNLVDYVKGVEVGLDSNGRKNRGGTLMEDIVEDYMRQFCSDKQFKYMAQATAEKIKTSWNFDIRVNKSSRRFDFAVYNPKTKRLKLVETNFFNGGGSKLKTVAGEFKSLNDELRLQGIDLLWITDGLGWKTAARPLEETYNHNNGRIYNLAMLNNNVLDKLEW